jgi:hypothetical protein
MAVIRICHEVGCRVQLSKYNPTKLCWDHREAPRRLKAELEGKYVQRDDYWLLMQRLEADATVETWRPHMCSDTFVDGMSRREMSDSDRMAYESGEWLG